MRNPHPKLLLVSSVLFGRLALAQPSLEFAAGGGPSGNGSTLSTQVVTFQNNGNNPTGNTFTSFVPKTTVSFALSNQQYSLPSSENANKGVVSFGATDNSSGQGIGSFAEYSPMNGVSGATPGLFSSLPTTIGTGMSLTNNYGTEFFTSAMGLYNSGAATNGRYYMATLTITFNQPVLDPVLQLVGIGGDFGSGGSMLGFTTELELQTPGVTFTELSGSPELSVSATKILNGAAHPSGTTGSGAASGSILVTGNNITQLVFKLYFRGDGGNAAWSNNSEHTGDAWLIGFSMLSTAVELPVEFSGFTAMAQGSSAVLGWAMASEENVDDFLVQRSVDGVSWGPIGVVAAAASGGSAASAGGGSGGNGAVPGASPGDGNSATSPGGNSATPTGGNSAVPVDYSFVDPSPVGGNDFYRVVEVGLDSSVRYSQVAEVVFSTAPGSTAAGGLSCFPNPGVSRVTVRTAADTVASLSLMDIGGRVLQRITGFRTGSSIDVAGYPAGLYLLCVRNADGTSQVVELQKE